MELTEKREIEAARNEIDAVDAQITDLLGKRIEAAEKIGFLKKKLGLEIFHPERERDVLKRVVSRSRSSKFPAAGIEEIFKLIIKTCREIEEK